MCTGLEAFAIAATIASTATTAVAQKKQGDFQEDVGQYNAKMAEFQARDAMERGLAEEEIHRAKVRQIRGQQMAVLGASGVETSTGTAADVLDLTTTMGEEDALRIRTNAEREAWGFTNQATEARLQGRMSALAGRNSAFSTVLAGGASAYGMYRDYTRK